MELNEEYTLAELKNFWNEAFIAAKGAVTLNLSPELLEATVRALDLVK